MFVNALAKRAPLAVGASAAIVAGLFVYKTLKARRATKPLDPIVTATPDITPLPAPEPAVDEVVVVLRTPANPPRPRLPNKRPGNATRHHKKPQRPSEPEHLLRAQTAQHLVIAATKKRNKPLKPTFDTKHNAAKAFAGRLQSQRCTCR
jgi:hypothetical protein